MLGLESTFPARPAQIGTSPSKFPAKHILFALALIVSIGATLSGVLGLYKIAFFGGIGSIGSQVLTYGGGGVAASAFSLKMIDCTGASRAALPQFEAMVERRAHLAFTLPTTFPLLDEVRAALGQSQPLRSPRGKELFLEKMRTIYSGLLAGEFNLTIDFQPREFKRDVIPPTQIEQARAFIIEHLAFTTPDVDTDAFFAPFSEQEALRQRKHQADFINGLIADIDGLFADQERPLKPHHLIALRAYIIGEVHRFNAAFEGDALQCLDLHDLWVRMDAVVHFKGNIDKKIEMLSDIATALTQLDDLTWERYPHLKAALIRSLNGLYVGFFSQHRFITGNEADETNRGKLLSCFGVLSSRLGIESPSIEVIPDTSRDAEMAAGLQAREMLPHRNHLS